jgi:hypothetical protein
MNFRSLTNFLELFKPITKRKKEYTGAGLKPTEGRTLLGLAAHGWLQA